MLVHLKLQELNEKLPALEVCKSIIRVVERMVNDGYTFNEPQDVEQARPVFYAQRSPSPLTPPPAPTDPVLNLKVSGARSSTTEEEIEEFLFGIRVQRILQVISPNGKNTGNFYAKCISEEDVLEGLRYNNRLVGNRQITVELCEDDIFDMIEQNSQV